MNRYKYSDTPRSKPSHIRRAGYNPSFNLATIYGLIGLMVGIDYLQEVVERWQDPTASPPQRFVLTIEGDHNQPGAVAPDEGKLVDLRSLGKPRQPRREKVGM